MYIYCIKDIVFLTCFIIMLGFSMVETKSKGISFYNYLINNGYYFNKELIENYLL